MLPGFRFLVAAIIFSLSLLVFGLGAAALLRAAHEQFASNSAWRAAPETSYTAFLPQAEPPRPVLAMLRVEPNTPQQVVAPSPDISPQAKSDVPMAATESRDERAAATQVAGTDANTDTTVDMPAADTPKPDIAVATAAASSSNDLEPGDTSEATNPDSASTTPTAPRPAETVDAKPKSPVIMPALDAASVTASIASNWIGSPAPAPTEAKAPANMAASANVTVAALASNLIAPAAPSVAPKPDPVAVKTVSLGTQPVAGEKKASVRIASIQLHRSLMKKRLAQARRARHKRLMAERAEAARQAALIQQRQLEQQFADPFGLQQLALEQAAAQRQAATQRPR